MALKYEKCKYNNALTSKNKRERVNMTKEFIINGTDWKKVCFSDEKFFTLRGTNTYYSWNSSRDRPRKRNRVLRSPGIMVWGMLLPNGLMSYRILEGNQKSCNYVEILKNSVFPIMRINFKEKLMFQQDNCRTHVSKETKKFFQSSGMQTLDWPANSPDINIIENIWSMMEQQIYHEGAVKNLKELRKYIDDFVVDFNKNGKQIAENLYKSIPVRLVSIIQKRGDRIKY